MATQPGRPDQSEPIDPTIPGELPPVIEPDREPSEPDGFPVPGPDSEPPWTGPEEVPQMD